jgi:hypothetical protein
MTLCPSAAFEALPLIPQTTELAQSQPPRMSTWAASSRCRQWCRDTGLLVPFLVPSTSPLYG